MIRALAGRPSPARGGQATGELPETGAGPRLPLLVAALGVALVVFFDLSTALPFNDEFFYQWTVRRLGEGHGLQLFPGQAPIALVQLVVGGAAWALVPDPRVVRLTAIPFVIAGLACLYLLARDLGVARFYAGVVAAAPMGLPVFTAAATGFMSEPYYLGLLLACCLAATRWLRSGTGAPAMLLLAGLCALQRQHAAAIPPALTAGLLVASRYRAVGGRDVGWLVAAWVEVGGALLLPSVVGLQTEQMRLNMQALLHPSLGVIAGAVLYLPGMAGLALWALGGALLGQRGGERRWWMRPVVPACAAAVLLILLLTFILPGNYFTRAGLNPITVAGDKPQLFAVVLPVVGVLGLLCVCLLVCRPAAAWHGVLGDGGAVFLLVVGAVALLPLVNGDVFDRYYLVVVLPWLPLAASMARGARWDRFGRAWAIAALLVGLVIYVAGEQDYQAWQRARADAETIAERSFPARDVFSGFESYGVLVVLPDYERSGRLTGFVGTRTTTAESPPHPRAALLVTGPDDPRPGVSYRSLAPGRVVVQCLVGCPAANP